LKKFLEVSLLNSKPHRNEFEELRKLSMFEAQVVLREATRFFQELRIFKAEVALREARTQIYKKN